MIHKEEEELLEIVRLVYGDNRTGEESSTAGKIYRLINEEYYEDFRMECFEQEIYNKVTHEISEDVKKAFYR